jgi:hypothetical protein
MMDVVHSDKKWFSITHNNKKFLMAEDELETNRTVSHKPQVRKVMFLAALASLRFFAKPNSWWDGKIGMWPVGALVLQQHQSVLYNRGDLVWTIKTIPCEVYHGLLENGLIPALLTKWTQYFNHTMRIQQDG